MSEKKRDAGYRAALTGAKGTVRLLIYVCVILVIILAAKTSYQFGHDVFAEEPVASRGKGKEVTVQVRSGMEAKELGELLSPQRSTRIFLEHTKNGSRKIRTTKDRAGARCRGPKKRWS